VSARRRKAAVVRYNASWIDIYRRLRETVNTEAERTNQRVSRRRNDDDDELDFGDSLLLLWLLQAKSSLPPCQDAGAGTETSLEDDDIVSSSACAR
jgi:hypothetical protein